MKKFLKLGLSFLSLVPISLSVYACGGRVENEMYYDVNDKSSVKEIRDFGYDKNSTEIIDTFFNDLIVYDKNLEWNNEILESNIKMDFRIFKYLLWINSYDATDFFINLIDKWAKQFGTAGIDDFKGSIDYFFPDSFQGFNEYPNDYDWYVDKFYFPFQKRVNFGNAKIKKTPFFPIDNNDYECIFPETIEYIFVSKWYRHDYPPIIEENIFYKLKKIYIPSHITYDLYINNGKSSIFNFTDITLFSVDLTKDENASGYDKHGKPYYYYYYYYKENDKVVESYYLTDEEFELVKNRNATGMDIKISKTFDSDEALRFMFGQDLSDSSLSQLKKWITYI